MISFNLGFLICLITIDKADLISIQEFIKIAILFINPHISFFEILLNKTMSFADLYQFFLLLLASIFLAWLSNAKNLELSKFQYLS
jgi:hypothetical protein